VATLLRVERQRAWLASAAACVALVYGAYLLHTGARLSSDSRTYSTWADKLLSVQFNYYAYLTASDFVVPPTFYILWVTIVGLSKVMLSSAWPCGVLFLNWISASALVYALARTAARLTGSILVGLGATLMLASSLDVLLFLPFVLSDIIFMGIAGAIALTGLTAATECDLRRRRRLTISGTLLLLAACFFRPTAAPLVVFWGSCLIVAYRRDMTVRRAWTGISILAVVAAIAIVGHAALMQDPSRWAGVGESGWIRQLSDESKKGIVVFDRPETYVSPPQTLGDFVTLTLTKWEYYFAPWMAGYSRFHKAAGAVFFGAAYVLSLIAVLFSPRWRLTSLLVVYVGAFSLFHSAQQIDFDHRYRLPVLVALSLLAALGLEQLAIRRLARSDGPPIGIQKTL